jgi:small subunit ribosomal protein S5e
VAAVQGRNRLTGRTFCPSTDVAALADEGVKLFGKWEYADVDVKDISLADYICIRQATYLPHTAGRYASKQFRKAQMPVVERLVCA